MITVDVSEVRALATELGAAAAAVPTRAAATLRERVAAAEDTMRAAAPVATGDLRDSIGTTWEGPLAAEVGPTVDYAGFVEGGTSDTAPQPFVGPAADAEEYESTSAFERMLGDLL